jgi:hypothetical protein
MTLAQACIKVHWRKDSLFNKRLWENLKSTSKRWKLDSYISHCTKINSKWIKDFNVSPETLKLLGESLGKNTFRYWYWW